MATPKGYGKNISIKVHGVEELQAAIRKLKKSVQFRINQAAVNAAGKVIREAVRDNIPTTNLHIRSGNLKRSIQQAKEKGRYGRDEAVTVIYTQKKGGFHAHLLEYGHRLVLWEKQGRSRTTGMFLKPPKFGNRKVKKGFVAARPFFRPAVDKSEGKVMLVYAETMRAGINREVAGAGSV